MNTVYKIFHNYVINWIYYNCFYTSNLKKQQSVHQVGSTEGFSAQTNTKSVKSHTDQQRTNIPFLIKQSYIFLCLFKIKKICSDRSTDFLICCSDELRTANLSVNQTNKTGKITHFKGTQHTSNSLSQHIQ